MGCPWNNLPRHRNPDTPRSADAFGNCPRRRVIGPRVATRNDTTREILKKSYLIRLLTIHAHECPEGVITLVHPVTVRVGHDVLELEGVDALGIRRLLELFLTRQIVVYCGEVNLALALMLQGS